MKELFLPYKRSALGIVIALLMGLIFLCSMPFVSIILVAPIAISALFASAGWFAGMLAVVSTLGICGVYGAPPTVLAAVFAIFCLPAIFTTLITKRKVSFFNGMMLSILAQFLCLASVGAAVYFASGGDIVVTLVGMLSDYVKQAPVSELLPLVRVMGYLGIYGDSGATNYVTGFISPPDVVALVDAFFVKFEELLRQSLPSLLMSACILTGGVAYLWAVWIPTRRGDEVRPEYRSPSTWRLPAHAIIGLPLCMLITYIASANGMVAMGVVYGVFASLTSLMFSVQGVCAVDRAFKMRGVKRSRRIVMCALLILFVPYLPTMLGVYSALFGSRGLVSVYIKKKIDENKED